MGFFSLDSGILRGEALRSGTKIAKIKKNVQIKYKGLQANRMPLEIFFVDVVAVNFT